MGNFIHPSFTCVDMSHDISIQRKAALAVGMGSVRLKNLCHNGDRTYFFNGGEEITFSKDVLKV